MSSSPLKSPLSSAGMEREEAREQELRLKAALHYSVGKTCEQMGKKMSGGDAVVVDENRDRDREASSGARVKFSKKFISALSEATWRQLTRVYARDMETFTRHAKRQTIGQDDVKLIARHNGDLEAKLNVKSVELAAGRPANKRKMTSTAAGGGPAKKSKT